MFKFRIFQIIVITCAVRHVTPIYNKPTQKPQFNERFCRGNPDIESNYGQKLDDGYILTVRTNLTAPCNVTVTLDSLCTLTLMDKKRVIPYIDDLRNIFTFILTNDTNNLQFKVKGRPPPFHPPYVLSLKINGEEKCENPDRTYFGKHNNGVTKFWNDSPDKLCGRRKLYDKNIIELIEGGKPSQFGVWPWHAAIRLLQNKEYTYICGGTLISKNIVLTAAHCILTYEITSDMLLVILGKHILDGRQETNQAIQVQELIIRKDTKRTGSRLYNDIALLKLSAEAEFNNYVQPACIWIDDIYDHLGTYEVNGTVVGWGKHKNQRLSETLREATMTKVSDYVCIRYEPVFYNNVLDGSNFCAGDANGTSACNGDSGGGFFVFVEDKPGSPGKIGETPGAWYIKGIVSITLSIMKEALPICDPQAYTVFTDVAVFRDWILNNIN